MKLRGKDTRGIPEGAVRQQLFGVGIEPVSGATRVGLCLKVESRGGDDRHTVCPREQDRSSRMAPKHPAQLARSTSRREANSEPFIFPGRNTLERFVTGEASVSVTNKLLTRAFGNHAQLDPLSC